MSAYRTLDPPGYGLVEEEDEEEEELEEEEHDEEEIFMAGGTLHKISKCSCTPPSRFWSMLVPWRARITEDDVWECRHGHRWVAVGDALWRKPGGGFE